MAAGGKYNLGDFFLFEKVALKNQIRGKCLNTERKPEVGFPKMVAQEFVSTF